MLTNTRFSDTDAFIIALLFVIFATSIPQYTVADLEELPFQYAKSESEKTDSSKNDRHPGHKNGSVFEREHGAEADRKVIFGSEKAVHQFDELSPEDAKRRLRALARRMDTSGDGKVSKDELTEWVHNSLLSLDQEETKERFDEIDQDKNGIITWDEYLREAFGLDSGDLSVPDDPDDAKLLEEDRRYFKAADLDYNGLLNFEEFAAFQNPEHAPHMHQILIENTLAEKDRDKDGAIDLDEFMGSEMNQGGGGEWFAAERARFQDEFDKNGDGRLVGEELRAWLIPDLSETARQEAIHLIQEADTDKDGQLSLDEVVAATKAFTSSEATNYGERLTELRHEEL